MQLRRPVPVEDRPRASRTTARRPRSVVLAAGALAVGAALAGCSAADPLAETDAAAPAQDAPIVVGSQDYYSNEIVAELYAQALEAEGAEVDRQFRIGQREVYLPEIESGAIDLFPEYSGNLLQYFDAETEARLPDDVYAELADALPDGLRVLDQASATDQDSYVVTREFAEQWDLETIEDLGNVTVPLTFGANSEGETRPYGPAGLAEVYGIEGVRFTPIEDGGGPLTVKALQDGSVQLADIYTSSPAIAEHDFVVLEDTRGIFLSSNVVPLASERIDGEAEAAIDAVSAALTPEELIALNARSVEEELPAAEIAADWLAEQGLV
ncbi:ABC transporter substrate-binding protein [Leucobacter allii]|uniref:ABC transporter substrate-binding protein n=1 Tax=Leucobacter allii TaxID=2932247 RepID=A0ABY4FNU4_9MICO|nr:ABC transporter substrate-binding protein [Leucobacter allii]UOQ57930.1 ABC transporter substrate-binding protein [Leucobacter allii]